MNKRMKLKKARKKQHNWKCIGMFSDKKCDKCGKATLIQIYKHDAWACITCNEWLEDACDSDECPFCSGRPKTPYEVYWNTDFEINSSANRKYWRCSNYQHKKQGEIKHNEQ